MDNELNNFFGEEIDGHKSSFDPNNIRDYIDAFLAEAQQREKQGQLLNKDHYFSGNTIKIFRNCTNV